MLRYPATIGTSTYLIELTRATSNPASLLGSVTSGPPSPWAIWTNLRGFTVPFVVANARTQKRRRIVSLHRPEAWLQERGEFLLFFRAKWGFCTLLDLTVKL
jgi:hypothetical protein